MLIRSLYLADNLRMEKESIALAIQGLEIQRSKIDAAIRDLQAQLRSGLRVAGTKKVARSKRTMSPLEESNLRSSKEKVGESKGRLEKSVTMRRRGVRLNKITATTNRLMVTPASTFTISILRPWWYGPRVSKTKRQGEKRGHDPMALGRTVKINTSLPLHGRVRPFFLPLCLSVQQSTNRRLWEINGTVIGS